MMTLAVNDRISYKGEKATVKQVWKKKVKVILSDLREMTVGIDEIGPAGEAIADQLSLIDLSTYQLTDRPISQWDLENENSIESLTVDSDQSVDAIEIEDSLPNSHPNSLPNSLPNHGYEEIKTIKGNQYRYWRWLEGGKLRSKYLGRCENDKKFC